MDDKKYRELVRIERGWGWVGIIGAIFIASPNWWLWLLGGVLFAMSLFFLASVEGDMAETNKTDVSQKSTFDITFG